MLALQTLGAGDALGWSWLFPPYPWRFNASALELAPTKCDDDHSLGYEIVKRFAQVIIRRLQASQLPPMLYLWSRFANDMTTLSYLRYAKVTASTLAHTCMICGPKTFC